MYSSRASRSKLWERTVAWLIWGAFALHITGLLPRIHAAMEALSFQSGSHRFSLWLLFQAAAVIVVAVISALTLARLLESRLMGVTQMNLSLRMALSKAARTVFLILAVLVALPAVGIDLTVLSVFGGALGVGSASACRRSPATTFPASSSCSTARCASATWSRSTTNMARSARSIPAIRCSGRWTVPKALFRTRC